MTITNVEELGHDALGGTLQIYRYTAWDQKKIQFIILSCFLLRGAGMRKQLIEIGRTGCDAVWQVLEIGWETSAPEVMSCLSLG